MGFTPFLVLVYMNVLRIAIQFDGHDTTFFKVYKPPNHIRNPDKYYVFERLIPAFGTKRSQVQILSPRPNIKEEALRFLFYISVKIRQDLNPSECGADERRSRRLDGAKHLFSASQKMQIESCYPH